MIYSSDTSVSVNTEAICALCPVILSLTKATKFGFQATSVPFLKVLTKRSAQSTEKHRQINSRECQMYHKK